MEHVEELLTDYLTGSLEARDRAQVEAHLRTCRRCQEELRALEETFYALTHALIPVPPPPESLDRIRSQLRWNRRKRDAIRTLFLAAALGVAFALGIYLGGKTPIQETALEKVAYWASDPGAHWRLLRTEEESLGLLLWREDGRCLVLFREPPPRGTVYQLWGEEGGQLFPLAGGPTRILEADYGHFRTLVLSLESRPENAVSGKPRPYPPARFLTRLNLP